MTISSDRDAFIRLAEEIYEDTRAAASANQHLDREIFRDRQQLFVVDDGGRSIARVAARMRDGLGMLGHFEAHDDPDAVRLVLHTAAQWLRERVLREHRGSAVAAALQERGYRAAIARGAHAANHCLIRAGNRSESMDGGHGFVFRNYHLYRMPA